MNKSEKFLSELTIFSKYAHFDSDTNKRKNWISLCNTNMDMHIKKYPHMEDTIKWAFEYVKDKKVLPSMRSMQYAGKPIEMNPTRIYNCSYGAVDHPFFFAETAFLLLSGSGVGYSIRQHHIDNLPIISKPNGDRRFLVGDSIEGWSDSYRQLIYAYVKNNPLPRFDYSDIRLEGSPIKTSGGIAPGPKKLQESHIRIKAILDSAIGRKLNTVECSDIQCCIADAVVSGGNRDAAMIGLFDVDDINMATSKGIFEIEVKNVEQQANGWLVDFEYKKDQIMLVGDYLPRTTFISNQFGDYDLQVAKNEGKLPYYYVASYRSRANISAALLRTSTTKEQFERLMDICKKAGGEPGIFWCNSREDGANPCNEIVFIKSNYFCNLTTQNVFDVDTQEELEKRSRAAAIIGTLQAGYTDFHYLRPIWKQTTEEEALIGVSMTGIASGKVLLLDIEKAAKVAVETNAEIAKLIGINPAARNTCIKPEGSGTLAMGIQGNGIHGIYDNFYTRNNRIKKRSKLYKYLLEKMPAQFIADEFMNEENSAVITMPMKAPENAILRLESEISLLERIKHFHSKWIRPGHNRGNSTNNVSCTIFIRHDKWEEVTQWMWDNKDNYNGISCFPFSDGIYKQPPFQTITESEYNEMMAAFPDDITFEIQGESKSDVDVFVESACAGGACEI